jgi:hypothetical protein
VVPCSFTQIVESGRQRRQALLADAAEERIRLAAGRGGRPAAGPIDGGEPPAARFGALWKRLVGQGFAFGEGLRAGRADG